MKNDKPVAIKQPDTKPMPETSSRDTPFIHFLRGVGKSMLGEIVRRRQQNIRVLPPITVEDIAHHHEAVKRAGEKALEERTHPPVIPHKENTP